MHTITTSEELKSRIKADVSATVPLEGVAIESTSSYLRTVETSKTNLTQVIEEIILDDPVRARALDIKLTAAATSLLGEDPKKFAEKYGEYFVYGYIARARFTAVCTIKASSETLCNVIKTKLAAKAGDAKSLAASLESENSSNKEHCQMNINLEVDRLEGDSVQHRPHFEIGELTKAYENFQNHFQTTPYVALLCHYSVVDGRFPLPQHQFQYLGSTLSTAYQSLYLAQNELSNSCMAQTTGCAARIAKACDMVKYLDVNDENAMAAVQKEVKECLDEVDRWRLRFDLQNDAKKLARTDIGCVAQNQCSLASRSSLLTLEIVINGSVPAPSRKYLVVSLGSQEIPSTPPLSPMSKFDASIFSESGRLSNSIKRTTSVTAKIR